MITACIPLELNRGHVTEYTYINCNQSSAINMEAQVNVSHELMALLPDLVNKRMNTNICNKRSTSFYRTDKVRQVIVSVHCIVLKMTYGIRELTYFLMYKVNKMPFTFLDNGRGWGSV